MTVGMHGILFQSIAVAGAEVLMVFNSFACSTVGARLHPSHKVDLLQQGVAAAYFIVRVSFSYAIVALDLLIWLSQALCTL